MSITDIIAAKDAQIALTAEVQAVLNDIDTELATAQAGYDALANNLEGVVAGRIFREVYVDAGAGNDANDGSSGSPVATFAAARNLHASGEHLVINLLSDYEIDTRFNMRPASDLYIIGSGGSRTLTFAAADVNTPTASPYINFPYNGGGLIMRYIDPQSRQMDGAVTGKKMVQLSGDSRLGFSFCNFTATAGDDLAIFAEGGTYTFNTQQTTFSTDFAGLYAEGVAAGTDPQTLRRCAATNLTSF